jgi:hypothetical protein
VLLINYGHTAQEYRVAVLNVQKPRGLTPYGQHNKQGSEGQQQEAHRGHPIGGLKITVVQRSPVPAERRSCKFLVVEGNYLITDGCLGCPDQAESGQK